MIESMEFAKEFVARIKELNKEEFYEELFPKLENIDFGKNIIQYTEDRIKFLQSNEDSKKRYEISKKIFEKLNEKNSYIDQIFEKNVDDNFEETRRIEGGSKKIMEDFDNIGTIDDEEVKMEILCRMYAYEYERVCNMIFKPLAEKITGNKIKQCQNCIVEIKKFEPEMELILKYFLNKIRNSINHNGYYFDKEKNKIIFKDREEVLELPLEELEIGCRMQIVNEVCMTTAEESLKIPFLKAAQSDMKKIQRYCDILKIDYDKLLRYTHAKGYSIFEMCWKLEQKLNYRY